MIVSNLIKKLAALLLTSFTILCGADLNSQTYFSQAFDIDYCFNEGFAIGLIDGDSTIQVSGRLACASPAFEGTGTFNFSIYDGSLINSNTQDRFNVYGPKSSFIENETLITGTSNIAPEPGVWKVDLNGNVLDSFLYDQESPFANTRIIKKIGNSYYASLVTNTLGETTHDLIQLDTNFQFMNAYPDYIEVEQYDEVLSIWGNGEDVYFSVCRGQVFRSCLNSEVYRFKTDLNHELIYSTPEEKRKYGRFLGLSFPADDSSFYYVWNQDTVNLDSIDYYHADPAMVSKISYDGETIWDTYFWDYNGVIRNGFTAANGDLILVGIQNEHFAFQPGEIPPYMVAGGYATRIGSDGSIRWQRKVFDVVHCKNDPDEFCISGFHMGNELPNGDLLFTGWIDSIVPGLPADANEQVNTWVVKTDKDGCLTPNCGLLQVLDTTFYTSTRNWSLDQAPPGELSISPNPVGGGPVRIDLSGGTSLSSANRRNGQYRLVDALGRVVSSGVTPQMPYTLETQGLSAGVYTLQWTGRNSGRVWVGRLVVR
ncbi:hypothetical protein CEQ90_14895 [Lewinellaceae bacterium SD302]|nr:hypothetical protein CEQ90_14895 [Lewinellaceae bacterium SD302]